MEAVEFIKEEIRLCSTTPCGNCPLNSYPGRTCSTLKHKDPEIFVATVEKWSKDNPEKTTNGKKFKEVFGIEPDSAILWTWANLSDWWKQPYEEPKE